MLYCADKTSMYEGGACRHDRDKLSLVVKVSNLSQEKLKSIPLRNVLTISLLEKQMQEKSEPFLSLAALTREMAHSLTYQSIRFVCSHPLMHTKRWPETLMLHCETDTSHLIVMGGAARMR